MEEEEEEEEEPSTFLWSPPPGTIWESYLRSKRRRKAGRGVCCGSFNTGTAHRGCGYVVIPVEQSRGAPPQRKDVPREEGGEGGVLQALPAQVIFCLRYRNSCAGLQERPKEAHSEMIFQIRLSGTASGATD